MSWELAVSIPGDPVAMYAVIEGVSDNPRPIGGRGSGAGVDELNITLSPTSEFGPRLPEMISADNPNSSADAPGSKRLSGRSTKKVMSLPARMDTSGPSRRVFPDDDLGGVEFAKAVSLSFCLNKASSSAGPTRWRHNWYPRKSRVKTH